MEFAAPHGKPPALLSGAYPEHCTFHVRADIDQAVNYGGGMTIDSPILVPKAWYFEIVMPGVDTSKPGLYEWRIEGAGSYIGQYGRINRPRKEYGRNIRRLLSGRLYRKGKPDQFRRIHHELAAALREKRRIELVILENAEKLVINARESKLIRERGTLNGPRLAPTVPLTVIGG